VVYTHKALLRFTTALAVTGVLGARLLPPSAFAQPAAPAVAPDPGAPVQTADPPARAGRLARISGTVSFHPEGADHWDRAVVNYPVTDGYAFWAEPNAQADIEVAASRIVLDSVTEFDINTIDERTVAASTPRGQIYLRLRGLLPGETYTVRTPRVTVTMRESGRYAIAAGDTEDPTRVTVLEGGAQVTGPNVVLDVGPNQTGLIAGRDVVTSRVVGAQTDRFLEAQIDRERPPPRQAVALPPQVQAMPGGEELALYGTWESRREYGQIWYPPVAADWVPYRDGHWAWVAPWGWTWVDDQPWGFAPSHYGRWLEIDGRWAWSPGYYEPGVAFAPPVYAPAMVSFFEVGAAAVVGVGAAAGAFAAGGIGWCPLGWKEPYRPWYNATNNYYRNVNINNVTNVNITNVARVINTTTISNFANRHAMTAVPTAAMVTSADVGREAQRVDIARLGNARVLVGRQPLQPTSNTWGVSTGMARRMNLHGGPGGAGALTATNLPHAPGPALSPALTQGSAQGLDGWEGPSVPLNAAGGNPNFGRIGGGQSSGGAGQAGLGQRQLSLGQGGTSEGPQRQGRLGQRRGGQGGSPPAERPGSKTQVGVASGGTPGPAMAPRPGLGQGIGSGAGNTVGLHLPPQGSAGGSSHQGQSAGSPGIQRLIPPGVGGPPYQTYFPPVGGPGQRYVPPAGGGTPYQTYSWQGGNLGQRYIPPGGGGPPYQTYYPPVRGPSQLYIPPGGPLGAQ
jgi:hypothetical protein